MHAPYARGVSDVRAELQRATERLIAVHPPSAVTGRQIAAEADVNYARIHRHFGSKDQLIRSTIHDLGGRYMADALPPGALIPTPGVLARHPLFARSLTNLLLDEAAPVPNPIAPLASSHRSGLSALRDDLGPDEIDVLTAVVLSMEFTGLVHWAHLEQIRHLGGMETSVHREITAAITSMVAGRGAFVEPPRPRRVPPRSAQTRPVNQERSIEERLVHAAAALLAEKAPSAITGRELAARAGVNYGRIHSTFGSAADVCAAAVDSQAAELLRGYGSDELPGFFSMNAHPGFVRFLTRMSLAPDYGDDRRFFPFLERLFARHEGRHGMIAPITRFRYALSVMTQVTWALLEPSLSDALARPADELEPGAAGYLTTLIRSGT